MADQLLRRRALRDLAGDFIDDEAIGCHLAADKRGAKTPGALDHDDRAIACRRAAREHDTRAPRLGHALHDDRHGDLFLGQFQPVPVGNGLGVVKARPALADMSDNLLFASDPQICVLKAGETRCIEAAFSFRGITVAGVNEIPLDECLNEMDGLELAMTITQLRRLNGATPLLQPGFKDLELETPLPSQLDKNTRKN